MKTRLSLITSAVRKLSKNLLQMLLYVIHPEAAACLSTHVLSYSRFSSRKGNMWIARITLRSWIQQVSTSDSPAAESQNDVPIILPINRSGADDDAPIIFPEALKDSQEVGDANVPVPAAETTEPKKFKLTVSSLVISTNSFGDFSKLTLMSETIDDSRLVSFATDCQTLWQKFVNQPQTARCLIFLLALGVMCERLAVQYNAAIEASSNILKLDVNGSPHEDLTESGNVQRLTSIRKSSSVWRETTQNGSKITNLFLSSKWGSGA